ncbi:MAG: CBS domain-containing protein, partial [Actinobacteria bacterium]|nr:CBS domain-containing protein [Actinomycetota bacterium]
MTTPVLCASPTMEVGRAMRLMTDHRTRHLPVVDDGMLLGIVSLGDRTHWVTRELERTVTDLS